MVVTIDNVVNCCGCSACYSSCHSNAIEMKSDSLGFKYPRVDQDRCIECGRCVSVCPIQNPPLKYNEEQVAYGARLKSQSDLLLSQSGGASSALVERFISEGGVVYGAAFDDDFHVIHRCARTVFEADGFKGSKYVQSDLNDCFSQIYQDLKAGNRVLFIGTGCQVAGLRNFIPKKMTDNFFCADIVCHCAPSPKIWEDYIKFIENKYKKRMVLAKFRDKKFGWHSCNESFVFEDCIKSTHFLNGLWEISARPSCSKCIATSTKRYGDITFADFWGWEKHYQEWNDNKGVSLIIVNNPNGYKLFELARPLLDTIESTLENALQPQLQHPIKMIPTSSEFAKDYEIHGFRYVAYKYGNVGCKSKIKNMLVSIYICIREFISKLKYTQK